MTSPLLLLVVLCSYCCYIAHGGNEQGFAVVQRRSYDSEAVCSASKVNLEPSSATVSMSLVHRYGPCAPSQYSNVPTPSFSETLRHSRARTNYIMSQASKSMGMGMASTPDDDDAAVTIPTRLGGFVDSLEYVVTLGFGTPPVPQVLLMDTGSDVSWVQCTPCNSTKCYPQKDPLFDPSKSSTYAPIACNTDACRKLGDHYHNGCTSGGTRCGYSVEYADGSHSRGVYSNETLTLAPGITVEDFHFGCGRDQRGPSDKYDGLLGLGGARPGVARRADVFGLRRRLLVLPPGAEQRSRVPSPRRAAERQQVGLRVHSDEAPAGVCNVLHGDDDRYKRGWEAAAHPAIGIPRWNDHRLRHGRHGAPRNCVQRAAGSAPEGHEGVPPLVPSDDFDTCYNFTGYSNVTVPRVAFAFSGGATIDLDVPNGILVNDCLAFQESGPDDGLGIIGNVNQRTLEVLYDAGHGNVGFRAGAC